MLTSWVVIMEVFGPWLFRKSRFIRKKTAEISGESRLTKTPSTPFSDQVPILFRLIN